MRVKSRNKNLTKLGAVRWIILVELNAGKSEEEVEAIKETKGH